METSGNVCGVLQVEPLQASPSWQVKDGGYDLLVVCGPTASGKTSLAVSLARLFYGEIISADSRQIYRGLDIGSGKDLDEYIRGGEAVPYHLIGIVDPHEVYTLYHYHRDFHRVFADIAHRQRLPLLCGGTGLYLEAVVRGFSVPSVPEDPALRVRLMEKDQASLDAMLRELDVIQYEATDRSSKKRIVRSIEIALHKPQLHGESDTPSMIPHLHPLVLCTRWPRDELHKRIDARLDDRFSLGMVDEVATLRKHGVSDERLMMLGMEYKHITRYLRGETGFSAMKESLRRSIYQLSKRQETYFRGMERRCVISMRWIDNADIDRAVAEVASCFPKAMPG